MNFDVIEQKRIEKNLTVTKLCELADIDRSTYYKVRENPEDLKWSTACKLASALKLNAAEKSKMFS